MKYPLFVWVQGSRGPSPQVWHDDACAKREGKPTPTLARHEMKKGDVGLPIDVLIRLYPAPVEAPEPKIKLPEKKDDLSSLPGEVRSDPEPALP